MNTVPPKKRIRIYINVRQNLELANHIYEKHKAHGDASPLLCLEGFDWESTGPKIGFCREKHKEALSLSRRIEEIYRQRDAALAEITDIIRATKSQLKNQCPEKLIDWGFVVNDNAAAIEKTPP